MRLLCFGDSNTWGYDPRSYFGGRYPADIRWTDRLAADTGWTVLNSGMNGRSIPTRASKLPEADALVVMLGSNDLLMGCSIPEAGRRMGAFLEPLLNSFDFILLVAPPPMQRGAWVSEDVLVERSRQLAGCCRDLAGKLGIGFADAGEWGVELTFDGVHFSEAGHRAFAEGIKSALGKPQITRVYCRTNALLEQLTALWKRSVLATHHFLTESDLSELAAYVPEALAHVPQLAVLWENAAPIGFLGMDDRRLKMLFLSPDAMGRGLGGAFLRWGIGRFNIQTVCVNEQNPAALGFYEHLGFRPYKRTPLDEQGRPYPLLYLRLEDLPCSWD